VLYLEKIGVESYSGYKLHESPSAFTFKGIRHTVDKILDQWYEGGIRADAPIINYFKIRTDDGLEYIIRYDSSLDEWHLVR
jgi:hypothetical protein